MRKAFADSISACGLSISTAWPVSGISVSSTLAPLDTIRFAVSVVSNSEFWQRFMICPNCDHDNFESAVFCSDCGTRLPEGSTSSQPDAYQNTSASNLHEPTIHVSPRDLGGILNETFVIFRRNFVAFFLIALIAQIPLVLIAIVAPELASTSLFPELSETFPQAEEPLPLGIEGLDTDLDSEAPSIGIAVILLGLVAGGRGSSACGNDSGNSGKSEAVAISGATIAINTSGI